MTYETFAEAARHFAEQVREISNGGWDGPGLGEWDLRALVGHTSRSLITVETYLAQPAETEEVASAAEYYAVVSAIAGGAAVAERGREAGRAMGTSPAVYVDGLVGRVLPLAAAAGDPLVTTAAGGMRFSNYLPTRTFELVVHGLDIAAAAGLPEPAYSELVLHEVVALAGAAAVREGRAVLVLRALTGRGPLPTGFSVV